MEDIPTLKDLIQRRGRLESAFRTRPRLVELDWITLSCGNQIDQFIKFCLDHEKDEGERKTYYNRLNSDGHGRHWLIEAENRLSNQFYAEFAREMIEIHKDVIQLLRFIYPGSVDWETYHSEWSRIRLKLDDIKERYSNQLLPIFNQVINHVDYYVLYLEQGLQREIEHRDSSH